MHLEFTITTIIIVTDKCDSQFISHDVSHNSTELRNRYFKFFWGNWKILVSKSGANLTIAVYNASAVKNYNSSVVKNLQRYE
jgi:hypothetical protein